MLGFTQREPLPRLNPAGFSQRMFRWPAKKASSQHCNLFGEKMLNEPIKAYGEKKPKKMNNAKLIRIKNLLTTRYNMPDKKMKLVRFKTSYGWVSFKAKKSKA
ncbi:MAG: hypothetical protein HY392_02765 [Candidatus Diapherotrites archaeon]|nr:hypothetical protein [Candidatus Diapherotrites archaeon]